jgi:hypothetical protein
MHCALFEVQWDPTNVWVARARIARISDGTDGPPTYVEEREYERGDAFDLATTATVIVCQRARRPKFGQRVVDQTRTDGTVRSIELVDTGDTGRGTTIRGVPVY